MNFKCGLFFLTLILSSIPLFASAYPNEISKEAVVSIVNANYKEKLKSPFSKAAIRIYDKTSGFDEITDFSSLDDFENPAFFLKFYFLKTKAKIISVPFLNFVENETKAHNAEISEIILNLTFEEAKYIFAFLKNLNENLPSYNYDFDLQNNNSFTHISAILNDCDRFFNKQTNLTSNRSFFNYSRNLLHSWKPQEDKAPIQVFSSYDNSFYIEQGNSLKLSNVSFSTIIFLSIISSVIILYTIYQTLVLFLRKFYSLSAFKAIQTLDFLILFVSGFAGALFLFQDFFSSQSIFQNNFQFFYLFPFNIVVAFNVYHQIFKSKSLKIYWICTASLSVLYIFISWILSKEFPLLDFFVALPVFIRSVYFAVLNFINTTER